MFRDPQQRGMVCYLLCRWIPGSPWVLTADGYKPGVVSGSGLSSGQRATILFAQDLWSGRDPSWSWCWDRRRMTDVATLFVALTDGPEAIDRWIAERVQ